jgi:hypothetical protein
MAMDSGRDLEQTPKTDETEQALTFMGVQALLFPAQ